MNLNFEFSTRPFWRPSYFPYSNTKLLQLIKSNQDTILSYTSNPTRSEKEDIDWYEESYRLEYLNECLVAEHNIQTDSNMEKAIRELFEQCVIARFNIDDFTVSLAKKLHTSVCQGLLENPGQFRTKDAKPAQENLWYLPPNKIESELNKLFPAIQFQFKAILATNKMTVDEIGKMIKLAALFVSKFLFIHPFSNGNGRVARLLCSCLLASVSLVPLSLTDPRTRNVYLDCLRDVNYDHYQTPSLLATLILERIWLSLEHFIVHVISE